MSAPLSPERLAEIAGRASAATSGVWHIRPGGAHGPDALLAIRGDDEIVVGRLDFSGSGSSNRLGDRSFIIAARQDVLALLAEVERLRGALSGATEYVAELESDLGGATAQVASLESRLHAVGTARTYRLESGKDFIYVEDIRDAVIGRTTATDGGAS